MKETSRRMMAIDHSGRQMMIRLVALSCTVCFLVFGCSKFRDSLFLLKPPSECGIDFINQLTENDSVNVIDYEYAYNGSGIGIGDFNNDGLPDVYFGGNMVSGKLYLNSGGLKFKDVTALAGLVLESTWVTGVSVVDINQDGRDDIYLSVSGPPSYPKGNLLFVNKGIRNGIPYFQEEADKYNLKGNGNTTHTVFFDYDKDGDLDAYMLMHAPTMNNANRIHPKATQVSSKANDRLYRNDSQGDSIFFTDVTIEAGIVDDGNGLGVAIQDLNKDGWDDIYVSNDYLPNDLLYLNNKDGTFTNVISTAMKHQSYFAMGNDIADINNDGLPDVVVLDMLPPENYDRKMMLGGRNFDRVELETRGWYDRQYIRNTLQLNNGVTTGNQLSFSEIGQLAGISETHWSWSPLLIDYDDDGYKDLSITNGYLKDITNRDFVEYKNDVNNFSSQAELSRKLKNKVRELAGLKTTNYVFKNNKDLTFSDQSKLWGFDTPSFSNGAAVADFDRDGDMDIIINNLNDIAFVYENSLYRSGQIKTTHYLNVKLIGQKNNESAIGAKVKIVAGGLMQYSENYPYRGYQSTIECLLHFGIAEATFVDSLWITWPDNRTQLLTNVKADQQMTVRYDSSLLISEQVSSNTKSLFAEVAAHLDIDFKHEEQLYIDFKNQPLIPYLYSQNGPGIAVGDVNGDGLDDFFIGGAFKQSGCFFIQQANGKFVKRELEMSEKKFEEDMGVLLFDADSDKDLDLYIVSGGSEFELNSKYYKHRLYLNDGHGNFIRSEESLPDIRESGATVNAADFDGDGDLDLFVGGRVRPNEFPTIPESYLLINESKKGELPVFRDRTHQRAPDLARAGMITSALWSDFNTDGKVDLILAGEWMSLTFFQNHGAGNLVKVDLSHGLGKLTGWWNCISGADFDQDGDIDYVAGNLGRNSKLKPTIHEPVRLYAKDFDGSGTIDPIVTYVQNGKEYPIALREDLIRQMNGMRRKFKTNAAYAKATLPDVFDQDDIETALQFKCTSSESMYVENRSTTTETKFKERMLPIETQFAPIYGVAIDDFDGDSYADLILTGNFYSNDATLGRYDASIGHFLSGDNNGNFLSIGHQQSGILADGDAKGLATLMLNDNHILLLSAENNQRLKAFRSNTGHVNVFVPEALDHWIVIEKADGSKSVKELYYGNSYLSQSTRKVVLPADVIALEVTDYRGRKRSIKFDLKKYPSPK